MQVVVHLEWGGGWWDGSKDNSQVKSHHGKNGENRRSGLILSPYWLLEQLLTWGKLIHPAEPYFIICKEEDSRIYPLGLL